MIYRDMPQDSFLKEVVLPVKLFEELVALAHVGESVLRMQQGWLLAYVDDKYHCTANETPVTFNSANPMEAIEAFERWERENGKANHHQG